MQEKIKKLDICYLIAYILAPIAICAICYTICYFCFRKGGTGAVMTTLVPSILAIVWWVFGGSLLFKRKTRELEKTFAEAGYKRNHTFYGRGKTVVLDIEKGMLGISFFWNPFDTYILPASRVEKAWTDDGKMGSGFMEGSSMVRFIFIVDGIKIAVPTFQSNQRFRMDDKHILTGISKADMMVQSIEEAKRHSLAQESDQPHTKATTKNTDQSSAETSKTDDTNADQDED